MLIGHPVDLAVCQWICEVNINVREAGIYGRERVMRIGQQPS
jgi:hypothetical protein